MKLFSALLAALLLCAPLLARAGGFVWLPLYRSAPTPSSDLEFVGLQRLDLPALTPSGLIGGLAAPVRAFATADGISVGYQTRDTLELYDTRTLQLRRRIEGFPGAGLLCRDAPVVQHPLRPEVLIFCGAWWYDTASGSFIETPDSLGFHHTGVGLMSGVVTVSAARRYLLVGDASVALGSFDRVRVIEFAAPHAAREFPAVAGFATIAFNDRLLAVRSTPASAVELIALDTGASQGAVAEPVNVSFDGFVRAGPGDSVLLEGSANGIRGLWQLDRPGAVAHQITSFPADAAPPLVDYEVAGASLLQYYLSRRPDCLAIGPVVPCYAGPMQVATLNLGSGAQRSFSLADGTLLLPGPLYSPAVEQLSVPVASRAGWFALMSLLAALGLHKYRRGNGR